MSKSSKQKAQLRSRLDQFNCIGKKFPDNGEGLRPIGIIEEFHIGYGFDGNGKIIGWEWNTRYSLTAKESIEFHIAMLYQSGLTECPIQPGDQEDEEKWFTEILNAMR